MTLWHHELTPDLGASWSRVKGGDYNRIPYWMPVIEGSPSGPSSGSDGQSCSSAYLPFNPASLFPFLLFPSFPPLFPGSIARSQPPPSALINGRSRSCIPRMVNAVR